MKRAALMTPPFMTSLFMTSLLLTLCLAGGVGAQTPPDSTSPEAPAGEHWSAWSPPTSYAPDARIYIIQGGDTLWDIARQMYGDPYSWPQLWEQNQYILDANLIYPGDPLLIPDGGQQTATGMAGPPLSDYDADADAGSDDPFSGLLGGSDSGDAPIVSADEPDEPIQLGYESDIYCTGFIGEMEETFPYMIASSEYEFLHPTLDPRAGSSVKAEITGLFGSVQTQKYLLGVGDITYLQGGRADGLAAGEVLTVVEPGHKIIHPVTQEPVGRFYHYRGRIRVLSVQDETSIGEVVTLCDRIHVGLYMTPFVPEPVPLERLTPMRPLNYPPKAESLEGNPMIIATYADLISLAAGSLAYIDQGALQDVVPGDIYTIYRQGRRGYPPIMLGELGVLSVFDNSALVRVIRHRYTIHVGDVLERK